MDKFGFAEIFEDYTSLGTKIKKEDYQESGVFPIIDQGQNVIAGYTDEESGVFSDVPAIIFGDHTRIIKFVDTPFFLGADGIKLLKSKLPNANYKYLYYALRNAKIPNTGYNRHFKWLKEIEINYPTETEQQIIVDKLEKIEYIIADRQQQLNELDRLIKSRFIEMFGDPLHPVHSRALGDVAVLERGRFSPRPRNDPRYYGGDYPFIQTGDIAGCGHRLSEYRQTLNEKGIHVSKKFPAGTIVIAIVGATIGATAILEIDVYAPDSVIGISVNGELYSNVFMETLLQFWQPELVRIAPESARANINLGILQGIPIIDVELSRQLQFAAFVRQTDKSKSAIQKSLNELQILFDSLMQEYFG